MRQIASTVRSPLAALVIATFLALTCAMPFAWAQGAGDMIVTPTRIVLEGRDRSAQVTISNQGSAAAVFRISLIDMTMDENGELKNVEPGSSGVMSAEKLIRYAPRQITIDPGASQVVRLAVRKPAGLADGEYRSHLFFRAIPDESAGRNVAEQSELKDNELRIKLIPIYGITIPVIVRQGHLSVDAGLNGVKVEPAGNDVPARIVVGITRAGTMSAFGDLTATYRPADGGQPIVVAQVTRVAVYTPLEQRKVVLPLRVPDGVKMGAGTLDVVYRAIEKDGGQVLAKTSIQLN